MMKRLVLGCLIVFSGCLLFASSSLAGVSTHYVWTNSPNPMSPYMTWSNAAHDIQSAINVSGGGDTIIVTNGVYDIGGAVHSGALLTNRVYINKYFLTVKSVNGPDVTIIKGAMDPATTNGPAAVRCVAVVTNAVLSGFTLTDGYTGGEFASGRDDSGAGVLLYEGGVLSNCVITSCTSYGNGGGAYMDDGGEINGTIIRNNEAVQGSGGGINVNNAGSVNNCLISENSSDSYGGGVNSEGGFVNNCTIAANEAGYEGGGIGYEGTVFRNCIIYHNIAESGRERAGYSATFEYCCTTPMPENDGGGGSAPPPENGGTPAPGCITNDPGFLSLSGSDYRLRTSSPCVDAGTNGYVVGTVDLEGGPRIVNTTVDMGAYESAQLLAITSPASGTIIYGETTTQHINGTADAGIIGQLTWTNADSGAGGSISAQTPWSIASVPIAFGDNTVTVSGTNAVGEQGVDAVVITRVYEHGGVSPNHYTWTNSPSPAWPYTNWSTAAREFQDAVDAAVDGDTVWATNGVYDQGGAIHSSGGVTSRVLVAKTLALRTVGNRDGTIIRGQGEVAGGDSVRCVSLHCGSQIHGFTLEDGYAYSGGMGGGGAGEVIMPASSDEAGGMFMGAGTLASNCVIRDCTAGDGGGVVVAGGFLTDCEIWNNTGNNYGGGVYCTTGTVTRCTIVSNDSYYGGGVSVITPGVVRDSIISTNTGGDGGGVYSSSSEGVINCMIEGNWADDRAGGIYIGGGAIISDCTIRGNSGRYGGGGIVCFNGGTIIRCRVTENETRQTGAGGVDVEYNGIVRNCLITGNRAQNASSGVYFRDGGVIENCTVADNYVIRSNGYGAIYFNGGGTVRNSIVYHNRIDTYANGSTNFGGSGGSVVSSCTTPVPSGSTNVITDDPEFVSIVTSNYHLQVTSPCIDTGSVGTSPSLDLDGVPRPLDGDNDGTNTVDMGCYEVLNAAADSDSDGLTDGDEVGTYGTNPAKADTDGDDFTDYQEMVADTDGADGDDFFVVNSMTINSPVTVSFDSSASRDYTLLMCEDLIDAIWTNVPGMGPRAGTGGIDFFQATNDNPRGNYSVKVELK